MSGPDGAGVTVAHSGAAVAAPPPDPGRADHTGRQPHAIVPRRARRRPSGEPPPLPHQLNASGKWWVALACGVIVFWFLAATTPRTALWLAVADHGVLDRVAALRSPTLTPVMKAIGLLATGQALQVLWLVNLLALLFWRRWRHLFVWIGAGLIVSNIGYIITETSSVRGRSGSRSSGPGRASPCPPCQWPSSRRG